MSGAFLWGLVAGSSLVLGGVVALRFDISQRLLGLIMAFGGGVLISAVAYELVGEAFAHVGGQRRRRARPVRGRRRSSSAATS